MKQRKRRKANIVAKDLRSPKYKLRKEKPKKGKGSYNRQEGCHTTNKQLEE